MGWFCLLVELHWEGFAPAACAVGLISFYLVCKLIPPIFSLSPGWWISVFQWAWLWRGSGPWRSAWLRRRRRRRRWTGSRQSACTGSPGGKERLHGKSFHWSAGPSLVKIKLVSPSYLHNSLSHAFSQSSFVKISLKHYLSQTIRARERKFWENSHPPPPVTGHMWHVMCLVSHVIIIIIFSSIFSCTILRS